MAIIIAKRAITMIWKSALPPHYTHGTKRWPDREGQKAPSLEERSYAGMAKLPFPWIWDQMLETLKAIDLSDHLGP